MSYGDHQPCRWIRDKEAGRIFMPGCMGAAARPCEDDPFLNCTCPENNWRHYKAKDVRHRISELEWELEQMRRVLGKLERQSSKVKT